MAVVKADAYGHGIAKVLPAFAQADALAVATVDEGIVIRRLGYDGALYVLSRVVCAEDIERGLRQALGFVLHTEEHVDWYIRSRRHQQRSPDADIYPDVWLKLDTGMHRLGLREQNYQRAMKKLSDSNVTNVGVLSHFACADQPEHPLNAEQIKRFEAATLSHSGPRSMANSGALIGLGDAVKFDWVRPGIMLYGSSPLTANSAQELGLQAALRLSARLVATREHKAGESVGYGATWTAQEETTLGIVALGYADGYPRTIAPGTAVSISGRRCQIVGRVSMDTIVVNLGRSTTATVGDEVELYGDDVSVDEVAKSANTISYELLVRLSTRATTLDTQERT